MTPQQTVRRNQIQHILDNDRPAASWIVEQMSAKESTAFDAAVLEGGREGRQAVGEVLVRVGRAMGAKSSRAKSK